MLRPPILIHNVDLGCLEVWLWLFFKVFFILKCVKIIFFYFLKLFLRSAHQNDRKHTKKINFKQKNLTFLKIQVDPRFQTLSSKNYLSQIIKFVELDIKLCYPSSTMMHAITPFKFQSKIPVMFYKKMVCVHHTNSTCIKLIFFLLIYFVFAYFFIRQS